MRKQVFYILLQCLELLSALTLLAIFLFSAICVSLLLSIFLFVEESHDEHFQHQQMVIVFIFNSEWRTNKQTTEEEKKINAINRHQCRRAAAYIMMKGLIEQHWRFFIWWYFSLRGCKY